MTTAPSTHARPHIAAAFAEAGDAWPQLWRCSLVGAGRAHVEVNRADPLVAAALEAFAELALLGPFTLEEIAILLGCCRQRVHQIEEAAIRHIRERMRRGFGAARLLRDYEGHVRTGAGGSVWDVFELESAGSGWQGIGARRDAQLRRRARERGEVLEWEREGDDESVEDEREAEGEAA